MNTRRAVRVRRSSWGMGLGQQLFLPRCFTPKVAGLEAAFAPKFLEGLGKLSAVEARAETAGHGLGVPGAFKHHGCTSQRPPLSGPMRRRRPWSLSLARWFLTARPLRPSRAPRAAIVGSGSARGRSRIFWELFWIVFWEPGTAESAAAVEQGRHLFHAEGVAFNLERGLNAADPALAAQAQRAGGHPTKYHTQD